MPTANTYEELHETIATCQVWLDSYPEKSLNYNRIRKEGRLLLEQLKSSWEAEICKLDKNDEDRNFLNQEKAQKESLLMQTNLSLKEAIHQDNLKALIAQQPSFAEALRGQVKEFSRNRFSGLSFENEEDRSDEITDGILKAMDAFKNFTLTTVAWRGAKGHYEEQLKEICTAKLRGKVLTSQDAHRRFEQIIHCLNAQETILFK
jgi:hypothetical protein